MWPESRVRWVRSYESARYGAYGHAMEQVGDYPTAVRHYTEALALEPTHTFTWHFINHNLGFCLNTLGHVIKRGGGDLR